MRPPAVLGTHNRDITEKERFRKWFSCAVGLVDRCQWTDLTGINKASISAEMTVALFEKGLTCSRHFKVNELNSLILCNVQIRADDMRFPRPSPYHRSRSNGCCTNALWKQTLPSTLNSICRRLEVTSDVISGVGDNGTGAYQWAKFHCSSSYCVWIVHFCTDIDLRTDTVLVAFP